MKIAKTKRATEEVVQEINALTDIPSLRSTSDAERRGALEIEFRHLAREARGHGIPIPAWLALYEGGEALEKSHDVSKQPRVPKGKKGAGEWTADDADRSLSETLKRIAAIEAEDTEHLMDKVPIYERFRRGVAEGQLTEERFAELQTKGVIPTEDEYKSGIAYRVRLMDARGSFMTKSISTRAKKSLLMFYGKRGSK